MDHACAKCRFWTQNGVEFGDSATGFGQCYRYPPSVPGDPAMVNNARVELDYPITMEDDWCGEFRPKTATKRNT